MTRVALVTGASAGIGRATAELLAARGWAVVGASRRGTGGDGWQGLAMDVDRDEEVSTGVRAVLAEQGRLDAVIAAAGWGLAGPVETTTIAEAQAQLDTNLFGVVRVVRAALPHLRRSPAGRVVVVGSIAGQVALPFQAYYSASKFALEGWAEALAYEVAPFGVAVTIVQPGNVRTDFTAARRLAAAPEDAYATACRRAIQAMAADELAGVPPAAVAAVILRQLSARRPRRRVSVGRPGERVGLLAKRALPHRWFEFAARGGLGLR